MTLETWSDDLGPSRYRVDVVDPAGNQFTELETDSLVAARLSETLAWIHYGKQWGKRIAVLVIDQEDGRLVDTENEEVNA